VAPAGSTEVAMPDTTTRWVTIETATHRWKFDADFLVSSWTCIYGQGCRGCHVTQDARRADGCCTTGTQITDGEDFRLVSQRVALLDDTVWQFRGHGTRVGWWKQTAGGDVRTRTTRGGCIFLNRPDFATGPGCAFHHDALRRGDDVMLSKPNVCWQFPFHSESRDEGDTDGGRTVVEIRPWTRADWTGAADYEWWCTDAPEAFVGANSVFRTMERELRSMCGDDVYNQLASRLA
jgi:hypothetical protein